jgi:hypothetical protein
MLEPVPVALPSVSRRAEHGARPLHAFRRPREQSRFSLVPYFSQAVDCECYRITEQTAQTQPHRDVAILFHAVSLSRFWNSGNMKVRGPKISSLLAQVAVRSLGKVES